MTIKPLTIDNLGVDASKQYARNQQELDLYQKEDSRIIPRKTEVTVTTPYAPSEYESKFSIGRITNLAMFHQPAGSAATAGRLFTYQLVPSLGSLDTQETLFDRIAAMTPADPTTKKEQILIHNLLQTLVSRGQTFEQIRTRRFQYQKG
jgi:hypothetical protein